MREIETRLELLSATLSDIESSLKTYRQARVHVCPICTQTLKPVHAGAVCDTLTIHLESVRVDTRYFGQRLEQLKAEGETRAAPYDDFEDAPPWLLGGDEPTFE